MGTSAASAALSLPGPSSDAVDVVEGVDGAHLADELAAVAVTTFGGPVDGEAADRVDGEPAEQVDSAPRAPLEDAADEQTHGADQIEAVPTEVPAGVRARVEPEVDPTVPVARRGRRKRGRVVAPAGPPRATASEEGPGSESAAEAAEVPTH